MPKKERKQNKKTGVDKKRRKKLEDTWRALASLAFLAVLPKLSGAVESGPRTLTFKTAGNTQAMHFSNTGLVGIGTDTPNARLKVYNTLGANNMWATIIQNDAAVGGHGLLVDVNVGTPFQVDKNGVNLFKVDTNGYVTAVRVYDAVWNDLTEFRPLKSGINAELGKVYVATEEGIVLATKKAQLGTVGVCSDTYGFALGDDGKDKSKAPIAISGWVLGYVDKKYPIGTALVSGPNGNLTKAGLLDKLLNSERIVGIVETSPAEYNNLNVDGRYWVKVS